VGNSRRIFLVGLIAFVAFMVFHGVRPWQWSAQTEPPAGIAAHTISYTCGPPFGAGYVHGPTTTYPIAGTPCGQRHEYQTMIGLDVLLGLAGVVALSLWGRSQTRPAGP
jgi:hypothetical protein